MLVLLNETEHVSSVHYKSDNRSIYLANKSLGTKFAIISNAFLVFLVSQFMPCK